MSTQPLEQAIASTRAVLGGVNADQMSNSTPCESWDVSALINHIVGGQYFFKSSVEGAPPGDQDVDYASGDYVAAFDEAASASLSAFDAEGAMERMLSLPFGEMPASAFIGLATTDTFTHGWDLAKATGQSTDLAPELAAQLLAGSKAAISEAFRGPDSKAPFGTERTASEGANNADQLAAFLGREA